MIKNNIRFFSLKLTVMLIVNVIFVIISIGLEKIFGEIHIGSLSDSQNLILTKTLLSAIIGALFFTHVFFMTRRMKFSADADKSSSAIVKFSVRETLVYLIYLAILYIIFLITGKTGIDDSFIRYIYTTHTVFYQAGLGIIINDIIMTAIYFLVSAIARITRIR